MPAITGSKDLQNVNITLRILFRPKPDALPEIYTTLGQDYDDRVSSSFVSKETLQCINVPLSHLNLTKVVNQVLPSITNEVLKQVVAEFDAGELITMREQVSSIIS